MIQRDSLSRKLYATDASMYEELPAGVAFPEKADDIRKLVLKANEEGFSITARSAGTSLAGQTTGGGVIMDVSPKMNRILELNAEEKYAVVQPGVIRDTLNREAAPHDLLFGPDTSTTNRCMLGGMIGNNSSGSFSIKFKTTRESVLELQTILSDGSEVVFKALTPEELDQKLKLDNLEGYIYRSMLKLLRRNKELILENYPHPEILRRNTGYALDKLCEMQPLNPQGRPFNMAELLCGSEGTLAMTVSAKVKLLDKDHEQLVIVPQFDNLRDAMVATKTAVKAGPAAVELVDYIILDATKGNIEQRKNRFFLDGEPRYILITQFEGNDKEELRKRALKLREELEKEGLGYAYPVIEEEEKMRRVWDLRKAGLGLLMGLGEDSRSPSFCEDTAVRVEDLPEYVEEFEAIMHKYNTDCVFYAHASVGELHLRPVIDITTEKGMQVMKDMAEEIADLVRKYRGSLSGEHGDGRARAPYIPRVLGEELMPVLRQVKDIWDPNGIFNPGKIVNAQPIDTDLRFSPSYKRPETETVFAWRKEGSLGAATELCNGAGVCRKLAESGGTMCPSYMATGEEKDSTRGRANVFRQVFAGEDPAGYRSEELKEALDLCLSCKACKSECPANVDMAKMKAEFMHGWHKAEGAELKERFFTDAAKIFPLASLMPKVSNAVAALPPVKQLMETIFGIDSRRALPEFSEKTFRSMFKKHRKNGALQSEDKVVLFADLFTNYNEAETGLAAVEVLEAMGFEVLLADVMVSGRPQLSKGFLDEAKEICSATLAELKTYVKQGIPVVGLEPSEILTLRDEFLELCSDKELPDAQLLAENSFTIEEFVVMHRNRFPDTGKQGALSLHGHCHAKALTGNEPYTEALTIAGYEVEELQTGCCGMAGSFGYEKDHYDTSMEIGELVLFPALRNKEKNAKVCAPGFSCRHQIKDGTGRIAEHSVVLMRNALIAANK